MAEKKKAKTAKKSNLKGRQIVDTVRITVQYKDSDVLTENGVDYVAEPLVRESVYAGSDKTVALRYRMALKRGKFNTVTRYGIVFIDTMSPQSSPGALELQFHKAGRKKVKEAASSSL